MILIESRAIRKDPDFVLLGAGTLIRHSTLPAYMENNESGHEADDSGTSIAHNAHHIRTRVNRARYEQQSANDIGIGQAFIYWAG